MVAHDFIGCEKVVRNGGGNGDPAGSHWGWYFNRKVKVDYQSANVLSLERVDVVETMGDKPTGGTRYLNFRPSTGDAIRLEDILKPGFEKPLNSIGEVRYRAALDLAADQEFSEIGIDFGEGGFQLGSEFSIGPEGLVFFLNPHTIAWLETSGHGILLPYSTFRNFIRPDAHVP
jgi:hypothetical protein